MFAVNLKKAQTIRFEVVLIFTAWNQNNRQNSSDWIKKQQNNNNKIK